MTSRLGAALAALCLGVTLPGTAAFPAAGARPDTLTLDDCARLARERAPAVRAAEADAEASAADALSASRAGRPVFKLFGGATAAPKGFYDPAITNLGQYELKAGMDLPLADGGTRSRAAQRAAADARTAGLTREKAGRDAAQRAVELAAEVLRLQEHERQGVRSMEWLEHLEALVKPAAAAGVHGAGEVLRVALERDGVETALRSTRTDLGVALRELAELLGLPPGEEPRLREPPPGEDRMPAPEDSARATQAVDSLPEVRMALLAGDRQRLDLEDVERRNALNVSLSADAGLAGTDLTSFVPPDLKADKADATFLDRLRRDLGASVTVQLTRTVSDPTAAAALRARIWGMGAAGARFAAERAAQRRATLDLLAQWRSAAERRASLDSLVVRADDNLLRSKSLYVVGALSLLELLDARQVSEDARGRLADARADERKARAEVRIRQ